MAKYLVIVESPAKVKTIKKFLGSNYDVQASNGHVRDFPKSQFGIDVDNDFEPKYITIRGKGELLAGLRKAAKKADKIYLATDPDREGEAIYQDGREEFYQAAKGSGYEPGRCTAGEKNAGQNGRIYHQPASLGQGQERLKCGPCAVCSTAYHL